MTDPTATLASGDALAAGQTLRSWAHAGQPNQETAELLGRVGDWLIAAALASDAGRNGEMLPMPARAAQLVLIADSLAKGDQTQAASSLMTALITMLLGSSHPKTALALAIATLREAMDYIPPTPSSEQS